MRFMAVRVELDDDIVGCKLIDAMEEVSLIPCKIGSIRC
jgi:hypothetical protein